LVVHVINPSLGIVMKPVGVVHESIRRGEVDLRPQRSGIVGVVCLGNCRCSTEENEGGTHFASD
jgi:hypothetical protein